MSTIVRPATPSATASTAAAAAVPGDGEEEFHPPPNSLGWGVRPFLWYNTRDFDQPLTFLCQTTNIYHPSVQAYLKQEQLSTLQPHRQSESTSAAAAATSMSENEPVMVESLSNNWGCSCPDGECHPSTCACAQHTPHQYTRQSKLSSQVQPLNLCECWEYCTCHGRDTRRIRKKVNNNKNLLPTTEALAIVPANTRSPSESVGDSGTLLPLASCSSSSISHVVRIRDEDVTDVSIIGEDVITFRENVPARVLIDTPSPEVPVSVLNHQEELDETTPIDIEDEEEEKDAKPNSELSTSANGVSTNDHIQVIPIYYPEEGVPAAHKIRLVRVENADSSVSVYAHASDVGRVIELGTNNFSHQFESPSERLLLRVVDAYNHTKGQPSNVFTVKGVNKFLQTNNMREAHDYRNWIRNVLIPKLVDPPEIDANTDTEAISRQPQSQQPSASIEARTESGPISHIEAISHESVASTAAPSSSSSSNLSLQPFSSCFNRVVQRSPIASNCKLVVFKTAKKGWGVRTLTRIPKFSYVLEYIGEVIHEHVSEQRGNLYATMKRSNYLFSPEYHGQTGHHAPTTYNVDKECFSIDSQRVGHISRFLNHSCDPNLITANVYIQHRSDLRCPRVAFFACKNIEPNEELTFYYGYKDSIHQEFECHCQPCRKRRLDEKRTAKLAQINANKAANKQGQQRKKPKLKHSAVGGPDLGQLTDDPQLESTDLSDSIHDAMSPVPLPTHFVLDSTIPPPNKLELTDPTHLYHHTRAIHTATYQSQCQRTSRLKQDHLSTHRDYLAQLTNLIGVNQCIPIETICCQFHIHPTRIQLALWILQLHFPHTNLNWHRNQIELMIQLKLIEFDEATEHDPSGISLMTYQCQFCSSTYRTRKQLCAHRGVHQLTPTMTCADCKEEFLSAELFELHQIEARQRYETHQTMGHQPITAVRENKDPSTQRTTPKPYQLRHSRSTTTTDTETMGASSTHPLPTDDRLRTPRTDPIPPHPSTTPMDTTTTATPPTAPPIPLIRPRVLPTLKFTTNYVRLLEYDYNPNPSTANANVTTPPLRFVFGADLRDLLHLPPNLHSNFLPILKTKPEFGCSIPLHVPNARSLSVTGSRRYICFTLLGCQYYCESHQQEVKQRPGLKQWLQNTLFKELATGTGGGDDDTVEHTSANSMQRNNANTTATKSTAIIRIKQEFDTSNRCIILDDDTTQATAMSSTTTPAAGSNTNSITAVQHHTSNPHQMDTTGEEGDLDEDDVDIIESAPSNPATGHIRTIIDLIDDDDDDDDDESFEESDTNRAAANDDADMLSFDHDSVDEDVAAFTRHPASSLPRSWSERHRSGSPHPRRMEMDWSAQHTRSNHNQQPQHHESDEKAAINPAVGDEGRNSTKRNRATFEGHRTMNASAHSTLQRPRHQSFIPPSSLDRLRIQTTTPPRPLSEAIVSNPLIASRIRFKKN